MDTARLGGFDALRVDHRRALRVLRWMLADAPDPNWRAYVLADAGLRWPYWVGVLAGEPFEPYVRQAYQHHVAIRAFRAREMQPCRRP